MARKNVGWGKLTEPFKQGQYDRGIDEPMRKFKKVIII